MQIPGEEEFRNEIKKYENHMGRDSVYIKATFLIKEFWGKPTDMADSVCVLLLNWNQAFYRFGNLNFQSLEECIAKNLHKLEDFRNREITGLLESDKDEIQPLFNKFLSALQIKTNKKMQLRKSPVSVSKTLHLLAPKFFIPWDTEIAKHYGCYYDNEPAKQYISFCEKMQEMAIEVKKYIEPSEKSILKSIDEYNYSKYTKKDKWK